MTLRSTRAFAARAACSASAVVTVGSASTKVTVAVRRGEVARRGGHDVLEALGRHPLPLDGGDGHERLLVRGELTAASLPARSVCSTSSVATAAVLAGSVVTTASTSREETSEVAKDDQDSLAENTASTVASTSTV